MGTKNARYDRVKEGRRTRDRGEGEGRRQGGRKGKKRQNLRGKKVTGEGRKDGKWQETKNVEYEEEVEGKEEEEEEVEGKEEEKEQEEEEKR